MDYAVTVAIDADSAEEAIAKKDLLVAALGKMPWAHLKGLFTRVV